MARTTPNDDPSIVPSLEPVGKLLRDGVLEVPPYQRSYAWREDQVLTYWLDLRAALVAGEPLYFLGTVVVSASGSDRSVVIDGQQRLATTSILLAAIRDAFATRGDETRADTVQERYLRWTSLESNSIEPRLQLNKNDREYFTDLVAGKTDLPPDDAAESVRRLARAYALIAEKLDEDIDAAGPHWQDRLLEWTRLLDSRVRVIVVRVRDDADAFLIFETLNARGVELSAADLIKNYLFGLCRGNLDRAQDLWANATSVIEESARASEFTTFLRHWWASRNGAVREKELYRRIKVQVQSEDQALVALEALFQAAGPYSAMMNPEHELWSRYGEASSASADVLLDLGLEQYRPLLLAAMQYFSKQELQLHLNSLISWSVRGLIVGGIGGGTTERYYAEAAVRITNGRVTTATGVLGEIEPVVAGDDDFRSIFSSRRVTRNRLIHYYLRALNEQSPTPHASSLETFAVPVIPHRDPSGEWSKFVDAEIHGRVSNRIGNYVLVPRDQAVGLPSDPAARIDVLVGQDLLMGGFSTTWNADTVDRRQGVLASLAPTTWPRRP